MNNEMNNNLMNNNLGENQNVTPQEPTFGGKFFPSLEDEPTNMNMTGPITPTEPTPMPDNPPASPNFIDLTDSSANNQEVPNPNLTSPVVENSINPPIANTPAPSLDNQVEMPNPEPVQPTNNMMPDYNQTSGNTINLDALTSNYDSVPNYKEPASAPMPENTPEPPSFDMSQTINPNPIMSPDIGLNNNANVVDPTPLPEETPYNPTVDMNINAQGPETPMMDYNSPINIDNNPIQPETPNMNYNPEPSPEMAPPLMNNNIVNNEPNTYIPEQPLPEPTMDIPNTVSEGIDLTPAVNTIKSLADNLNSFGYTVTTTEEETPTSKKIIIEINK